MAFSRGVRALHGIAEIEQHFGDAGHADAADADEMDGAEFAAEASSLAFFLSQSATSEHEIGEPVGGVGDAGAFAPPRRAGQGRRIGLRLPQGIGQPLRGEIRLLDDWPLRPLKANCRALAA